MNRVLSDGNLILTKKQAQAKLGISEHKRKQLESLGVLVPNAKLPNCEKRHYDRAYIESVKRQLEAEEEYLRNIGRN